MCEFSGEKVEGGSGEDVAMDISISLVSYIFSFIALYSFQFTTICISNGKNSGKIRSCSKKFSLSRCSRYIS